MYTKYTKLECMWERERWRDLKSGRLTWRCLTAWDLVTYLAAFPSFFFPWKSKKFWRKKVWEKIYRFLSHISEIFDFVINPAVDIGTYGRPVVFLCLRLWILLRLRVGFHHCFYRESSLRNRERKRKRAQWRLLWEICMS